MEMWGARGCYALRWYIFMYKMHVIDIFAVFYILDRPREYRENETLANKRPFTVHDWPEDGLVNFTSGSATVWLEFITIYRKE